MAMIRARWRIYYNYANEFPLVWSFDDGNPEHEQKVPSVAINGHCETRFDPAQQPHGWIEIEGEMEIVKGGVAVFWGPMHARQNDALR